MKKKITAFIISMIWALQGFWGLISYAETVEIPDNALDIQCGREEWVEEGLEVWYKFDAPTPYCALTDIELQQIGDYIYGSDVKYHSYYDADGNYLGIISNSNDPDIGPWTEFIPGDTYYLKITTPNNGTFFTLVPLKGIEPSVKPEREAGENTIELTLAERKAEKFIDGEVNELWDVYTVSEKITLGGENEIISSAYFVAPERICFGDPELITDGCKVTYSSIERAASESWDTLKSYTNKPYSANEKIDDGSYAFAANSYFYIADPKNGSNAEIRYNVYVPAGMSLLPGEDNCIYTAKANDLFGDVANDKWYADAVLWCAGNGYMSGTASAAFSPNAVLTRAQLVLILANLDGTDLSRFAERQSFTDVPKGKWYSAAVEWANEVKVTSGIGEGVFAPSVPVSREQLAVFLCAYASYAKLTLPVGADLVYISTKMRSHPGQRIQWQRPLPQVLSAERVTPPSRPICTPQDRRSRR